ncbi:MAG TPA: efflux RND transporter periplasmic adaptor subunit [Tepidisphaeraceae bacterium]|jgi:multidrug efflux pump subunit AcrA (membrane-fusion protein)
MSGEGRRSVWRIAFSFLVFAALIGGVAALVFRPEWLKPKVAEEHEKEVEPEVPVKVAPARRMALHRWVEAFGTVEPAVATADGKPAGGATLTSPVAGVITQVRCGPGQVVEQGAVLFQLDDRLAKAAEGQAAAVLESARAALARLRATPRPEQLALAQLGVDKARDGVDFAQKQFDRQKLLSSQEVAATKTMEAAAHDLAAAQNELRSAQGQLTLLKNSPTPEELTEATAKVTEAEKALAAAQVQHSMMQIRAPLRATVTRVMASPGEAADTTRALAQLVAMDRLVVNAAVPVGEASLIKVGQRAQVEPTPGQATVSLVGYDVDRKNNTVTVTVSLPAETPLRPGSFQRVKILVDERGDALAVPWKSVVRQEDGSSSVAVVHGEKAQRKTVTPGLREGDWVEIGGDAVKEGDQVVTDGAYGLPKEAKVHVGEEK